MYVTFDGQHKGRYVELSCDRTKARRQLGFCDGVVVSDNFIEPGKLVAVEILETQRGWSGDLRVGFTMLPNDQLSPLPSFALPPLVTRGKSWIIQMGDVVGFLLSQRLQTLWKRQQIRHKSMGQIQNTSNQSSGSPGPPNSVPNSSLIPTSPNPNGLLVHNGSNSDLPTPFTNGHIPFHSHSSTIQYALTKAAPTCSCCLHTVAGRIPFSQLVPTDWQFVRSPDVERGSIVAVYYELDAIGRDQISATFSEPNTLVCGLDDAMHSFVQLTGDSLASSFGTESNLGSGNLRTSSTSLFFVLKFHVVINGIDLIAAMEPITVEPRDLFIATQSDPIETDLQNPNSSTLVFEESYAFPDPLDSLSSDLLLRMRAVFDVYGQTKAIQLIPLNQKSVPSLSRLCSCAILNQVIAICDSEPGNLAQFDIEPKSGSVNLRSSTLIALSRSGQAGLYPMDNQLMRRMTSILTNLPLPRTERLKLQRDAYAIVVRRLSD